MCILTPCLHNVYYVRVATRAFFLTKIPQELNNLDKETSYSIENDSGFTVYLHLLKPGSVGSVSMLNGGMGYTEPPLVGFSHGGGNGAKAEAFVDGGCVVSVVVTECGEGYGEPPLVTIAMPEDGIQAKAVAFLRPGQTSPYTYALQPSETIEIPPLEGNNLYA